MTDIDDDPRRMLDRLLTEKGVDYAQLSARIGRNPAYIQQYIKRGSPRRLGEQDRARIAAYLGVSEALLGGPALRVAAPTPRARGRDLVLVPKLAIGASAGPGASVDGEAVEGEVAFDPRWLRDLGADPRALSIIRVEGDSMAPTLGDGDDILVDGGDAAARLRDGIYVLRMDDVLMVKRIARAPGPGRVSVISDNPHYRSWDDLPLSAIRLVGRVIWTGRRVR
ncbi:Phage repressor protein C, contains Cro/C1-type HTH and peptisase s24 domains [Sphingopyxis terrae subsp. ummariensis]|uniref:Phage repressor protein C, contains Cro/C1-type HTH and peptisase s24 domains n=2 Tax=Sphingomonadaceae TaxID=41297 RepID=A0A1Y6EQV5_9SPHN|nr:putative phage repressor [Sphingopyxis sp. MC1]SMQ65054.1 Phage repressor protein C, contains Cro/C1-type HTH and peptisase s24 domains [Sphingopyxis terrae subsp. ummariensis]